MLLYTQSDIISLADIKAVICNGIQNIDIVHNKKDLANTRPISAPAVGLEPTT
jgi:hypothetical protein